MGIPGWSKMYMGFMSDAKGAELLAFAYTSIIAFTPWQEPCQGEAELSLDLGAATAEMTEQSRNSSKIAGNQKGIVLMRLIQDLEGWIRSSTWGGGGVPLRVSSAHQLVN